MDREHIHWRGFMHSNYFFHISKAKSIDSIVCGGIDSSKTWILLTPFRDIFIIKILYRPIERTSLSSLSLAIIIIIIGTRWYNQQRTFLSLEFVCHSLFVYDIPYGRYSIKLASLCFFSIHIRIYHENA